MVKKHNGYKYILEIIESKLSHTKTMMAIAREQNSKGAFAQYVEQSMEYEDIKTYIEQKMERK